MLRRLNEFTGISGHDFDRQSSGDHARVSLKTRVAIGDEYRRFVRREFPPNRVSHFLEETFTARE